MTITRESRPFAVLLIVLICTLLLGSCGSDDEDNGVGEAEQALIDTIDENQSYDEDSEMSDLDRIDAIAESACTLIEAQESGGYYVKDGESFYPLLEASSIDYNQGGTKNSDVYQHPKGWDHLQGDFVPELDDDMQIVYFSSDVMPKQLYASPILKDGYTIDTSFVKDPEDGSIEVNSDTNVETVNGESIDAFVSEYGESGEGRVIVAGLNQNDTVSLERHEGTEYVEDVETADVKWFLADGHIPFYENPYEEITATREKLNLELTNDGYAVIDVSGIESGMFYIWDDRTGLGDGGFDGRIYVFNAK